MLARDRVITELRLRLPASAERDKAIAKATAVASQRVDDTTTDYEGEKAVRVAQSTVHHLQVGYVYCIMHDTSIPESTRTFRHAHACDV